MPKNPKSKLAAEPRREPLVSAALPEVLVSLFPFLPGLIRSAENLRSIAIKTDFPDLADSPRGTPDVVERIRQAREWGLAVSKAYGHAATRECGYTHPEPKPLLVWFQFRADQQQGAFDARMDRPGDVLGDPPIHLTRGRADDVVKMCNVSQGKVRRPFGSRHQVEQNLANWPDLRVDLGCTRMLAVIQVCELVDWVLGRVEVLRTSLLPEISKVSDERHNRVRVLVKAGGSTRVVDLTHSEAQMLDKFERGIAHEVLRKVKQGLTRSIPELELWIEAVPGLKPKSDLNRSRYTLNDAARAGLRGPFLSPPSKK